MIIKKITWEEILSVWQNDLWPSSVRSSAIEPTSAMSLFKIWRQNEDGTADLVNHYDLENMKSTPTFWGCFIEDKLIGVNSGHMCVGKEYRSRGLWVNPKYRGMSIGTKLLVKTVAQGYHEGAILCWSYPRFESWLSYHYAGFRRRDHNFNFEWEESETGNNSKCIVTFDTSIIVKPRYDTVTQ